MSYDCSMMFYIKIALYLLYTQMSLKLYCKTADLENVQNFKKDILKRIF